MPLSNTPATAPRTDLPIGTSQGTVAAGNDPRLTGALQARNNLSDLSSPLDARAALGLGTAAVLDREDVTSPASVATAVDGLRISFLAELDQLKAENDRLTQALQLHAAAITKLQQTPIPDPGIPALPPRPVAPIQPLGNGPAGMYKWVQDAIPTINDLRLILKALGLVE